MTNERHDDEGVTYVNWKVIGVLVVVAAAIAVAWRLELAAHHARRRERGWE